MILLLLACTAAKESTDSPEVPGDPTLAADIQPLFDANCVVCHTGAGASATLSLAEGESLTDLQQPSTQVSRMVLLEPGSPASSYLMYKINGTHQSVGGSGTSMPPQIPLLAEDQQLIEAWILAGALP
jgi:mono/diheme cytochrome c family protein